MFLFHLANSIFSVELICNVDTSRRSIGSCSLNTSRCSSGPLQCRHVQVQLSPLWRRHVQEQHRLLSFRYVQVQLRLLWCRHMSSSNTGSCSPDTSRCSKGLVARTRPGVVQASVVQTRPGGGTGPFYVYTSRCSSGPLVQTRPGAAEAPVVQIHPGAAQAPVVQTCPGAVQAPVMQTHLGAVQAFVVQMRPAYFFNYVTVEVLNRRFFVDNCPEQQLVRQLFARVLAPQSETQLRGRGFDPTTRLIYLFEALIISSLNQPIYRFLLISAL